MGCTESRDKQLMVPGASELENFIFNKECHLGLYKVNYELLRSFSGKLFQSPTLGSNLHLVRIKDSGFGL
jgi:hypothetical protein